MKFDVVRTWKNANDDQELAEEQFNSLPNGESELTDEELQSIYGGLGGSLLTISLPINVLSGNMIPILGSISDSIANPSGFYGRYKMGTRFNHFDQNDWDW
jgi:mersacidin/lichenicidin family type 2 lantibiotic